MCLRTANQTIKRTVYQSICQSINNSHVRHFSPPTNQQTIDQSNNQSIPSSLPPEESALPPAPKPADLSLNDYLRMILTAKVYDVAHETPLQLAKTLSSRVAHSIYLKREDLQPVFSFKLRGAYNKMSSLSDVEKSRGVLTCSAGNHAQGVALAASKMNIKATILMPVFTPSIKVDAVRRLGAEVIMYGEDFDAAATECRRLASLDGRTIIHPYDDPHVIAGQGTIGMEILRQWTSSQPIHTIFVCVGGGGLIAGVGAYIKCLMPNVRIVGVEAVDACAMYQSLDAGRPIELRQVGLFADGAAVRSVGKETFRLAQQVVDEVILVNNDEICAAINDAYNDTRSVLEPAGALALAGAKRYISEQGSSLKGQQSFVCITSGANINFTRLRFVAERAQLGENKEALLAVTIPETPGTFMKLYRSIYPRNVTEFSYRFMNDDYAHIYLSFEVSNRNEIHQVIDSLNKQSMKAVDISDNEMAKDHTRYLAGGRSPNVSNERVFRFTFPDRPGALLRFLETLAANNELFNVTLFHYRNYGSDTGKVLAGIQVPVGREHDFDMFLSQLNYPYAEETQNPVYKQFLL